MIATSPVVTETPALPKPPRCECNLKAYDHGPGRCPGWPQFLIDRADVLLEVCDNCILSGDRRVTR